MTLVLVTFILRLAAALVLLLQTSHVKTENSCEFVDLLYIVVYILDEIKFSFTEKFSFTGSTDGCYQFLKALRRSAGSCKVVCKLSISHIARWVPGAFPRYDFYPFFFDFVNTRSQDPVYHDVKQER